MEQKIDVKRALLGLSLLALCCSVTYTETGIGTTLVVFFLLAMMGKLRQSQGRMVDGIDNINEYVIRSLERLNVDKSVLYRNHTNTRSFTICPVCMRVFNLPLDSRIGDKLRCPLPVRNLKYNSPETKCGTNFTLITEEIHNETQETPYQKKETKP